MNLFVVSFLGLLALSSVQTRQLLQHAPEDLEESSENLPKNYEYKEVILFLTPSEIKALEKNNVLSKSNDEYYSSYVNNQLVAQKQEELRKAIEQKELKPIEEAQEETTEKNEKINVPLLYPFQLIPLNNEKEQENEKKWIEDIKKQLAEEQENAKIENTWNPIPLKQNTQQIKTLLQNESNPKVGSPDFAQLLQNAAQNFDNKNVLKVQDYYRLQYELDQATKKNQAEDLSKHLALKQHPLFLYQSKQLKSAPSHILRAIRPVLKEETPETLVDIEKHHHLQTKVIFDTRRPHIVRELYRL